MTKIVVRSEIIGLLVKFIHLAYIEPRWYGNRISDCQQKLLFTKHNTSGRFLRNRRENTARRDNLLP